MTAQPPALATAAPAIGAGGGTRIGIVCGLWSERRALGRWVDDDRVEIAVSGAQPERAERGAEAMIANGASHLLSWGLAGGLSPELASGDLIQADEIVLPDRSVLPTRTAVPGLPQGRLLGSEEVILSSDAKAALARDTKARAVDMESHRVAMVASRRTVPCTVVRAVSDPSARSLPRLALSAITPEGHPKVGAVLLGLMSRPWDLLALLGAKRDSDRALAALSGIADKVMETLLADPPTR